MPNTDPSVPPSRRRAFSPVARRAATLAGATACGLAAAALLAAPARASYSHTVTAGETLSSIAAANGLDTSSLASWNGISSETYVVEGQSILVPTTDEAVAAGLVATPSTTTVSAAPTATVPAEPPPPAPASWLAAVQTVEGTAYLDAGVAASWESMRQESLATYGVDLMPAGLLSAYRSPEQQSYLYELFLAGVGAPANPPGSSAHERGVAVDVATEEMASVISQIGPAYGWAQTIPGEWWHFEWTG